MAEVESTNNDQLEAQGPVAPDNAETTEQAGQELPFEVLNGYPMYKEGHVLDKRCKIFERIGWDDSVGATYLALDSEEKELVVRIGNENDMVVKMEASFLCKMDQDNHWRMFSQVHSLWQSDDYNNLALYFRGGPTLMQCFKFAHGKFSHGTAGRLAQDVFQIIRTVHSYDHLVRSVSMDAFHFDACSRHLFMADISTICRDPSKVKATGKGLSLSTVSGGVAWKGHLDFAPIKHHDGELIWARDEYEAWFYMFVEMVLGAVPWNGKGASELKWAKVDATSKGLWELLPSEYKTIYGIISDGDSTKDLTDEESTRINELIETIYKTIGGVKEHDDNMDFEREPTDAELPRFVMEKVPLDGEAAENQAEVEEVIEEEDTVDTAQDED